MALSISQLQAQRDALQTALNSGVRSIHFQDRRIDYQSVDEMMKALAQLDDDMKTASGSPKKRYGIAQFTA